MNETAYEPGTKVRFTAGPLGLIRLDSPYKFVPETVSEGDEGEIVTSEDQMPEGWLLVRVGDDLYCPVHPGMVEAAV